MYRKPRVITKRKRRKKILLLISLMGMGVFTVCAFILLRTYVFKDRLYVSPLPIFTQATDTEENTPEKLKMLLKKDKIAFSGIKTATESGYIVTLETKEEILLSRDKDLAEQIASLQLILSRLTMEGREFRKLDLRFNKPIVIFK